MVNGARGRCRLHLRSAGPGLNPDSKNGRRWLSCGRLLASARNGAGEESRSGQSTGDARVD